MLKKYNLKNNPEIPRLISVVVDQGLMSIITLLTTIVLVRTYDKVDYADLVLLFSITLFVLGFQSSIISKPYAISFNDYEPSAKNSYFQFNLNLKFIFTILVCLVFPLLYSVSFERWNWLFFSLYLLYIIAYSSYYFIRETLLSERKTKENLIYGIICSFSFIILLLCIYLFQIRDIKVYLIIASSIYLAIVLFYYIKYKEKGQISKIQFVKYWKSNWHLGRWLLGSNLLFYISANIYPWFLLYLSTKDNIAIYAVLMSVAGLINPVLIALSSYLLPLFVLSNADYKSVRDLTRKWQFVFGAMALILVFVGFFMGQDIVVLLFGEQYNGLGLLVVYPFIYQAINVTFQSNKIALNAIKRTDVNFYILIPRSCVTLIIGYFLRSNFGLPGVFYTMFVENIVYQLIYYLTYRRVIST